MGMRFFHCVADCVDAIFPVRCVLCGSLVSKSPWWPAPLCTSCEKTLECIGGLRCERCGRPLISEQGLCAQCKNEQYILMHILPVFAYKGNAARLVQCYKIEERASLAKYFSLRLAEMMPLFAETSSDIAIVPVPPRPEKIRAGKFDQVGILANYLSRYGYRIWKGLVRRKGGAEQKTLARADRLKNAYQSYMLRAGSMDIPEKALLLDDVCTTGSTLDACAEILAGKGTTILGAIVLAAD